MAEVSKRGFSINYKGIDCTKVLMAILVVAIHTLQPYVMTWPVLFADFFNILMRVAVPFFFTVSGFLLCNKLRMKDYPEKLYYMQGWLFRIVRLYLVWTLIYLPYAIIGFYKDDLGFIKSAAVYVRNVIFVGENYLSWPLWYLLAMLVAGLIYYLILKLRSKYFVSILVILAVSLVGIGAMIDSGLIGNSWYITLFKSTRNGFFQGFPYMTIGFIISSVGYSHNKCLLISLLFIGVISQLSGVTVGSFITIYALFSIILSTNFYFISDDICKKIRLVSVVIYFVHMIWVGVLVLCFNLSPICLFVSSLCLSGVTSYFVIKNKNKKIVRFLF